MTEIAAAQKQLEILEEALASAIWERDNWEHQDLNRRDGSVAQDRRHEDRGERLENKIDEAHQAAVAQKTLIISLS